MKSGEFNQYLKEECEEIRKYRDEMVKNGINPKQAVMDWIKKNAKKWRDDWDSKK